MHSLLMVSDNHGDQQIITDLISIYQDEVDYLLHLGDSENDDSHPHWQKMIPIKGNNDRGSGYIEETVINLSSAKVFATHGHLYGVQWGLEELCQRAQEKDCSFAAYGHTHQARVEQVNGVIAINHGSISRPRGNINEKLYAILTVDGKDYQLDYYDYHHRPYEALAYQGSLE